MPIKRTAWACKWGCGRNVITSRQRTENHEKICFYNPARQACVTCKHLATDYNTVYNPHHNGNPGSTDYEETIRYCEANEKINLSERLRADCLLWTGKE